MCQSHQCWTFCDCILAVWGNPAITVIPLKLINFRRYKKLLWLSPNLFWYTSNPTDTTSLAEVTSNIHFLFFIIDRIKMNPCVSLAEGIFPACTLHSWRMVVATVCKSYICMPVIGLQFMVLWVLSGDAGVYLNRFLSQSYPPCWLSNLQC